MIMRMDDAEKDDNDGWCGNDDDNKNHDDV